MMGLKKRAFHQSFVILIHDYISLIRFVIPGSTEPALACPVLDTVLDTGESSIFMDSCWSLPRT